MTTTSAPAIGGSLADLGALHRPVDRDAVRRLRDAAPAGERQLVTRLTVAAVGSAFVNALLVLTVTLVFASVPLLVTFVMVTDYLDGWWIAALIALVMTAGMLYLAGRWRWRTVRAAWLSRGSWTHRWRMQQVASDSGLHYLPNPTNPPGSVLAASGGEGWDVFFKPGDPTAWFGNARSRQRPGQDHAENGWHYLAVMLPTAVPHLVLVPRRRSIRLVTPLFSFVREQRLRLEGDFDRHFSLYAPAEYERDALYVITPDLMALLIDNLPGSYVEAFDRTLVITTPDPADFGRPETWDRLERLLGTVVPKTMRQTRSYQDTRSPERGTVASGGRRLRSGISIMVVLGILFWIGQIIRMIWFANH